MNLPGPKGRNRCPLCFSSSYTRYWHRQDKAFSNRVYFNCLDCQLISVAPECLLESDVERAHYENHNNSIEDEGYVSLLNQVVEPLQSLLSGIHDPRGLDYGCGPGPTVAKILQKNQIKCCNFDPFFFPDFDLLKKKYEFVVATEVVEHFYFPQQSWEAMVGLTMPGGYIAITTQLQPDSIEGFRSWWYARDPTHVSFYSIRTLDKLTELFSLSIKYRKKGNVIFQKTG